MKTSIITIALLLGTSCANAATIYFCKGYGGGTFWSNTPCSRQQATTDRMVTVPDNMPFEQQVQIGEQVRAEAAKLITPEPTWKPNTVTTTTTTVHPSPGGDKSAECQALSAQITSLDAMARQPQPGQMQDWISTQKRQARDRQFQLRC